MKPAVLIVEDCLIISHHLESLVENAGFSICGICVSGEEAIELATIGKPAIILMDITLAGIMDGLTAAKIIEKNIHTKIVFLSALAGICSVNSSGEYKYFVKPFDDHEVMDFLKQYSENL